MAGSTIHLADIQAVSSAGGITELFARLGYDVSDPVEQSPGALGVVERVHHLIRQVRRIVAERPGPGLPPALEVYWFDATKLTADLRKGIVSAFPNKPGNFLLVMTTRDFAQIDLVLVLKSVQAGALGSGVGVSHQLLSVSRRDPSVVHLRVLNRMAKAGVDPYTQFDRIRDAFRLAEWSEDEFNNRNLFSDYFLKHRLRLRDLFPVWHEDFKPAHRQLRGVVAAAGQPSQLSPADYTSRFVAPVLTALGFAFAPGPGQVATAGASTTDDDGRADFLLRPTGAAPDSPPVAGLLVYPWDRPLDRKDDRASSANDPRAEDIPGIRVVKVLEQQKLPWAILTNGKDWRLYCAQAHSRATNYYEVDLPDALGDDDLIAFRYFYLFFRAAAFTPTAASGGGQPCFLDQLRQGSMTFAKELGDRLRQHIFDDVFPYLAQGFVDDHKHKAGQKVAAGDPFLAETYTATLTLLYRLLFLLYAESLDLLPVHEPCYAAISLATLKKEIRDAAGDATDAAEERLKARYTKSDTALYDRLAKLFAVIDEGGQQFNVPSYNGGLFSTRPDKADTTREASAARFLNCHKVPDFYLARALDLLARSEDAKTLALVFVDYKSLGVRQLGSVYEGLLMYHVVIPASGETGKDAEWEKQFQRPGLKVALVPSNQERKSTGSYFTPQHIVKYIVSNTVGPLLEEKFKAIAPRLRAAAREYHELRRFEATKAGPLQSVRRSPEQVDQKILLDYEDVVHDLFDIKVLDPATGSAHFLVETVDFITDRVLDFLAGFPWNPVQVFIDRRVRRPIIESLDAQGIKINEDRLTEVNLIKRLVMKRCVYGVDLNPMAVELAKVSLWLDSFTLGAPLSFLDHHLKCGNSLIGSTIADLNRIVAENGKLWSISDEPLRRAARIMEGVADLSDANLDEVHKSAQTYKNFVGAVRGYRAMLDCLTAEHFGVEGAAQLVTEGGDLDFEHWDQTVARLPAKEKRWVAESARISGERRFFHWDIEFPDVFFTARRPQERRAFDAVVGNPPYDELSEDEAGVPMPEKAYLDSASHYSPAKGGRQNLFRFFIINAFLLLRPHGRHGFIVPLALIADQFSRSLRLWMFQQGAFALIEAFPQKDDPKRRVFEEAKLPTVLYVVVRSGPPGPCRVRTNPAQFIDPAGKAFDCRADTLQRLDPETMMVPLLDGPEWSLLQRLAESPRLARLDHFAKPCSGEIVFNEAFRPFLTSRPKDTIVLRGGNVQRYVIIKTPKQGEPVYLKTKEFLSKKERGTSAFDHEHDRVVYQECAAIDNYRRIIPAFLPKGAFCGHKICYFKGLKCDPYALLAVFGSAIHEWCINAISVTNSLSAYQVGLLPFPRFVSTTDGRDGTTHHHDVQEVKLLAMIAAVQDSADAWPAEIESSLASLARRLHGLGDEQEGMQLALRTALQAPAEISDISEWTGIGRLDDVNYLGWDGRFPSWQPSAETVADGRWYANGVAPPLDGCGPGDIPWDLIARVYPSYPLPGIDAERWEAAAWEEFCDFLRKNNRDIGNSRIRADLTGRGAVQNPTGPMRKLHETFLDYHRQVRQNRAQAAEIDFLIDRIVFKLFDLTLDEQKLILSRVGPGRPLPPRRGRKGKGAKAAADSGPALFET